MHTSRKTGGKTAKDPFTGIDCAETLFEGKPGEAVYLTDARHNFNGAGHEVAEGSREAGHEVSEGRPLATGKEFSRGIGRAAVTVGRESGRLSVSRATGGSEKPSRSDSNSQSTAAYGVDPDAKEAVAFALMAYETYRKRASNLPSATGARRAAILGKLSL